MKKLSLRVLLVLPLVFSASLVSCADSATSNFKTPAVHGKVWVGTGGAGVSIPHGMTAL